MADIYAAAENRAKQCSCCWAVHAASTYCSDLIALLFLQALEDLVDAVGEVKALQERNAEADRNAQIEVSAQVLFVT